MRASSDWADRCEVPDQVGRSRPMKTPMSEQAQLESYPRRYIQPVQLILEFEWKIGENEASKWPPWYFQGWIFLPVSKWSIAYTILLAIIVEYTTSVLNLASPSQGTDYEERLHGSAHVHNIPKQFCPFCPHLTLFFLSNYFSEPVTHQHWTHSVVLSRVCCAWLVIMALYVHCGMGNLSPLPTAGDDKWVATKRGRMSHTLFPPTAVANNIYGQLLFPPVSIILLEI